LRDVHWLRRYWPHALLLAAALFFAGQLVFGQSEQQAVKQTVHDVLAATEVREGELPGRRDQRLQKLLGERFTDPITVRHSDLPRSGSGQRALLVWARLLQRYRSADLNVQQESIVLRGGQRATAQLDVELVATDAEGVRREQRSVEVSLVRSAERWRIDAIEVAPAAANQPEARP
jgi:hypothetical protein